MSFNPAVFVTASRDGAEVTLPSACQPSATCTEDASAPSLLAQGFEAGAHLLGQELRLLPGGEVSTLGQLVVVDQVGIGLLGRTPRWIEFVREDAHGNRDGDAFGIEIPLAPIFPIETGARNPRVRQPGDRDVVENVVAREALRLSVEDARDELQAARVVIEEYAARPTGESAILTSGVPAPFWNP